MDWQSLGFQVFNLAGLLWLLHSERKERRERDERLVGLRNEISVLERRAILLAGGPEDGPQADAGASPVA